MTSKRRPIIAIDGPAGAGKSTIARMVADKLGFLYIDTGAMYRAITWKALHAEIDLGDKRALIRLAGKTNLKITMGSRNGSLKVIMDGKDITRNIRSEQVSRQTNRVASVEGIRKILVALQRRLGRRGGVVMEGRDIGTRVFPGADAKFYLDASPLERARRRYQELKQLGKRVTLKRIADELSKRDFKDSHRRVSPLKIARGALVIDTTRMTSRQVAENIISCLP